MVARCKPSIGESFDLQRPRKNLGSLTLLVMLMGTLLGSCQAPREESSNTIPASDNAAPKISVPDEWGRYSNDLLAYSIRYPNDWGIIANQKGDEITVIGYKKLIQITVTINETLAKPEELLRPINTQFSRFRNKVLSASGISAVVGVAVESGQEKVVALAATAKDLAYVVQVKEFSDRQLSPREPVGDIIESFDIASDIPSPQVLQAWLRAKVPSKADAEARKHLENASRFIDANRLSDAEAEYRLSIQLAPFNSQPRMQLSAILCQPNRPSEPAPEARVAEAVAQARVAAYLDPRASETHTSLGCAYERQKKIGFATEEYMAAIDLDPKDPSPQYAFGRMLGTMGQFDAARRHLAEAVRLSAGIKKWSWVHEQAQQAIEVINK